MLYADFVILRKIYENSVRRNDEMEMTKNLYTNVMWYSKIITAEVLERERDPFQLLIANERETEDRETDVLSVSISFLEVTNLIKDYYVKLA
jgi:hypothetical protein